MRPTTRRAISGTTFRVLAMLVFGCGTSRAQDLPPPPPPARDPTVPSAPPIGPFRPAPAGGDDIAARLRAMEERNRELADRLERSERLHQREMLLLMGKIEELSTRLGGSPAGTIVDGAQPPAWSTRPALPPLPGAPGSARVAPVGTDVAPEYVGPVPEYETQPIEPNPFLSAPRLSTIGSPSRVPLNANFGPGFQFQTSDEEFLMQVHVQSQIESRLWGPTVGAPYQQDGFYLPRQRIFFNGRITRPIEYVFSINRGFGELNILETFLNFHFADQFQVRFGRYFTPLGYDQFAIRNLWLPTPERSLFTTNLGPNRQVGLMAWGFLLDKRLDYAAGVFTGPRNSFEDFNNPKDFMGYLNARPFQDSDLVPWLRDWNIGTSVDYGVQDQAAVPRTFRRAVSFSFST